MKIDKFKAQFDQGWDKYREETYQRQRQAGRDPAGHQLTPRPAEIPAWNSLSPEHSASASRLRKSCRLTAPLNPDRYVDHLSRDVQMR